MKILLVADREEKRLWGDWSQHTREALSEVKLVLSAGDLDPDYDKKNTFDIEKYLNRRMKLKAEEEFDVIQA